MEQLEFFDIQSPCVEICTTDARGYCIGCMRSRQERFDWLTYSDSQKSEVIRLCKQRRHRRFLATEKVKRAKQLIDNKSMSFDFDCL